MIHINIGSNLSSIFGNKYENVSTAIKLLIESGVIIKKISNFYQSPSYPNKNFPKFVNVGALVNCKIDHKQLLVEIKQIEKKLGRLKAKKNAPRVCDIDIVDFNNLIFKNIDLEIPHPRCHQRNFVLYPIKEIDSNWIHPVLGKSIDFLIGDLSQNSRIEITRLNKSVIIRND